MNPLHEQFVIEARELVAQAIGDLIGLERDGFSPDRIDRVFRVFHTLKGSAGVVELPVMSNMLHAAEDVLAAVGQGRLDADADVVDRMLASLDQISRWIDYFESAGALPATAGEQGRSTAEQLRSLLSPREAAREMVSDPNVGAATREGFLPQWLTGLIMSRRDAIATHMRRSPSAVFAISYEPIAGCFFTGDDPLALMRRVPDLLAFHVEPREAFPPLEELDPYACNLHLQAISAGDHAEIAGIFRLVPDQVRIMEIPHDALPVDEVVGDRAVALVRATVDAQCQLLRIPGRKDDLAGCIGAARTIAVNALRHGKQQALAEDIGRAGDTALSERDAAPLLAALERALAGLDGKPPFAAGDQNAPASTISPADATDAGSERVLRVNESKVEALVNLANELVVAKNALAHSAKRISEELGSHHLAAAVRRDHDSIERLMSELHGAILQLRMVPIARALQSFPRLVRDVSRQLGKRVELTVTGETTEADKTIVDRLFEPLVHLIRNALDHGIESPAQRQAAQKPETATISIRVSQAGDRLVVDVNDDGRGIDPVVVRRKASESQAIAADELAALNDDQVIHLIFSAGFSTASEVSDISGRGVGMDVVRAAVDGIGGRVSLVSTVGTGTTVRLDLPMTIAISRIMVVEAGGQLFGVAMDTVSETVRLDPDRISRIKANDSFVLRDRMVPIISLAELMKLPERAKEDGTTRLVLVVEAGGGIVGLEIDAIGDRLEAVLKPMQGLLAGARGYAGTTLLGNGEVLLVLDVKEIMP